MRTLRWMIAALPRYQQISRSVDTIIEELFTAVGLPELKKLISKRKIWLIFGWEAQHFMNAAFNVIGGNIPFAAYTEVQLMSEQSG